jgi:hypothetical protein
MQFSPFSSYFLPLLSEYTTRTPTVAHPLRQCDSKLLHTHKTTGKISVLRIVVVMFLDGKQEGQRLWTE